MRLAIARCTRLLPPPYSFAHPPTHPLHPTQTPWQVKLMTAQLDTMLATDPDFDAAVRASVEGMLAHIAEEEGDLLPRLGAALAPLSLLQLGVQFEAARVSLGGPERGWGCRCAGPAWRCLACASLSHAHAALICSPPSITRRCARRRAPTPRRPTCRPLTRPRSPPPSRVRAAPPQRFARERALHPAACAAARGGPPAHH